MKTIFSLGLWCGLLLLVLSALFPFSVLAQEQNQQGLLEARFRLNDPDSFIPPRERGVVRGDQTTAVLVDGIRLLVTQATQVVNASGERVNFDAIAIPAIVMLKTKEATDGNIEILELRLIKPLPKSDEGDGYKPAAPH